MSRIVIDCFRQRHTDDPDPSLIEANAGPVAFVIFNESGQIWKTTTNTFVSYPIVDPLDLTDYWITMTTQDGIAYTTSPSYTDNNQLFATGIIPASLPAGHYNITVFFWTTCPTCSATPSADLAIIAQKQLEIQWTGTEFAPIQQDVYYADIHMIPDGSINRYTVTWFKNGIRVTSGITSPTIYVITRSTGFILLSTTAMTQLGTTGTYMLDQATSLIDPSIDEGYLLVTEATIDSATRNFTRTINFMNGSLVS